MKFEHQFLDSTPFQSIGYDVRSDTQVTCDKCRTTVANSYQPYVAFLLMETVVCANL